MLDIQFIRDNPELVQEKSKEKAFDVDIAKLLEIDSSRRNLLQKLESLRAKRNHISDSEKGSKPSDKSIEESRRLKEEMSNTETEYAEIDTTFRKLLSSVPNIHSEDVPVGGEDASLEVKKVGPTESGAIDHLDFALARDWIDFERGTKVAGSKFYFLKRELALLENAVVQFAIDLVTSRGFMYMSVPHMVNGRVESGTGFDPRSKDQSDEYFIDGEDLTLIATAELPLTGYHADEILNESQLPLLYVGYSPCYRREAGTYGKHTRGLFRVHQFNKLEMYAYSTPEHSQEIHDRILSVEEEIWQKLGIPYHIINIASGDLGAPASKKYDIEYWSRADGIYRELTSCSNCTDFQARNLNIRFRAKGGEIRYVHTLNGTAVSTARTLIAIIEHYQMPNGKLKVPKALVKYLGGKTEL